MALAGLRRLMGEHSVYRGKVLTLANPEGTFGGRIVGATFLPRPSVERGTPLPLAAAAPASPA